MKISLGAVIPVQQMLDHTVSRIGATIENFKNAVRLQLTLKWGADGSSGLQIFHQKIVNVNVCIARTYNPFQFPSVLILMLNKKMCEYVCFLIILGF